MAEKKTGGRPSAFTAKLLDEICDRLAKGEPLTVICRDEHMPSDRTIRNWMQARADVSSAIAHAREVGFDALAAECLEIADFGVNDTKMVGEGGHEREVPDHEWISRSKLRVETRLKLLAKWDPKRYGDKIGVEHSGSVSTMTDDQIESRIAQLLGKAGTPSAA
jgi:hypothetical protein